MTKCKCNVMLLFEHKQYLQSCSAESLLNMEISSPCLISVSLMPTKMALRDYNKLLPGSVTS